MIPGRHEELDMLRDYIAPTLGMATLYLGLSVNTGEDPIPESAMALGVGLFYCIVNRAFSHFHFRQLRKQKLLVRKEEQAYRTRFYAKQERVPGHMQHAQFRDAPLQIYLPYIIPARIRLIHSRRQA